MPSRERLLRFAATAAELATAKRVRLVAQLLLVAALVFLLLRLRSFWHGGHVDLTRINWLALTGAFLVSAVGVAAGGFIWLSILRRLGVRTQRHWAGLYFQTQLGKYIPGTIWQYAGRAALSRAHGIPVRAVGLSLPVELLASALAAGSMSPLLLGWWGVAIAGALAVAVAAVERRFATRMPQAVRAGAHAWLYYLSAWPLIGLAFWLCVRSLVPVPAHDVPVYVGAYGVAWLVGLVAVYAPGGLGVREAVLVALLAGRLGTADAIVIAAVSRVIFTLVDLGLAGIGFAWLRRTRSELAPQAPVHATNGPHAPSSS